MSQVELTKPIRQFLKPFDKRMVALAKAARSLFFAEAPTVTELVYDAYSAVALGYSFTGRPGDAFCHIAIYSKWLNIGFNRGSELPDPQGLLVGSARLFRHLRIQSLEDLEQPMVRAFVRAAIAAAKRPPSIDSTEGLQPKSIVRAIYPRKRRPAPGVKARG